MSGAFKRYWLREAEPIIRAMDRIASGEVATEDLYKVALYAFNDEEVAAQCLSSRLAALNRQASLRGNP